MRAANPLPTGWLLSQGRQMVTDFVDIFHPDAVSMDSSEIMEVKPIRGSHCPVVGFVTWLSDAVVESGVSFPKAHTAQRYLNGTLIGIDTTTSDPVAAAISLSQECHRTGLLKSVPIIQGIPD